MYNRMGNMLADMESNHEMDSQSRLLRNEVLQTIEEYDVNETLIDLQGLASGSYQLLVRQGITVLWSGKLVVLEVK